MDRKTEAQVEIFVTFMAVWQALDYNQSMARVLVLP